MIRLLSAVVLGLLISCSPPPQESTAPAPAVEELSVKPTPAPPPPPELVILFEFEGVPIKMLEAWRNNRPLRVVQRQLRLDAEGRPLNQGDLLLLSPRLIPHFVANEWVQAWEPAGDLSRINPNFTSHRFDPANRYAWPWRWTPWVLLDAVADPTAADASAAARGKSDAKPTVPNDVVFVQHSGFFRASDSGSDPARAALTSSIPTVPQSADYRVAWESFLSGTVSSLWIPAACPLRNIEPMQSPEWKWRLPEKRTIIHIDHWLLPTKSQHAEEARDLVRYLSSPEVQHALVSTSGYFPVNEPLGREGSSSPIPLPVGDWLNQSDFVTLAPRIEARDQTGDALPTEMAEESQEEADVSLPDSPRVHEGPEPNPQTQTVY